MCVICRMHFLLLYLSAWEYYGKCCISTTNGCKAVKLGVEACGIYSPPYGKYFSLLTHPRHQLSTHYNSYTRHQPSTHYNSSAINRYNSYTRHQSSTHYNSPAINTLQFLHPPSTINTSQFLHTPPTYQPKR